MHAPSKNFCSVCSKAAGVAAGGTGWGVDRFLIPELALPWPADPLEARSAPSRIAEMLAQLWTDEVSVGVFAVAPDDAYSQPDLTRLLSFDFSAATKSAATRCDYLMPRELVTDAMDALARGNPLPIGVEVDANPYRDVMVCTHGSRDACCATFGFPLYRSLRAASETDPLLRVWRATHFGGHRFAPTMMTFPDGRSWGYLDQETAAAILSRNAAVESAAATYRGWSGYANWSLQLLEREAFLRIGWDWLNYQQRGEIIAGGGYGEFASAVIIATSPAGDQIEIRGDIEPVGSVSAPASCGDEDYTSPRLEARNVTMQARSAALV